MILSAMVFLLAASAVATAGAVLLEVGLRHLGAPTRFAWLAAMTLPPALLAARLVHPARSVPSPATTAWLPAIELPGITSAGPAAWGIGADGIVAILWAASAVWVLAVVARAQRALTLESAAWRRERVMGGDVLVSADRGPAVAGVWDPWIVVPRWALDLPRGELCLILTHEEEHVHAGDTRLLAVALTLVGLNAWNPLAWWQLRRLKGAIEIDCDRRVLARMPDRATYGECLLAVAARGAGPSLGLAAFTEGSLNLKRRILAMTAKATGWTALGGGLLVALGVGVGVQACGIESPVEPRAEVAKSSVAAPAPVPQATDPELGKAPVFTPYTRAPDLVNGAEVAVMLEKSYPPLLRDAGVGGTATVYIFIDERGDVGNALINKASGHAPLDEAALAVARVMRFTPAMRDDAVVPVWVSLPITFQVR